MSAPFTQTRPGRLRIIGADERLAERRGIKGVLAGASGIGKTSQLWTLDAASTLFVNLEAGELAVAGWPGDEVRVRDWDLARDLACWIGGPNPAMRDDQPYGAAHYARVCEAFGSPAQLAKYRTVFVDSITVASRLCLQWCKGQPQAVSDRSGKPDLRGAYGLLGQEMIAWVTHLQHTPDKNVWLVRLTIRPGGVGPEGWVTQSRTSDAQYLNTEAVILEGPHARRRVYTRIGLRGKGAQGADDTYANRGRALIRGILESARGIASKDSSDRARAARTIRGYGDLNGMEFLARIGVEKDRDDPRGPGRNVIAAAIGPEHADYARLMGAAPAQPMPPGPAAPATGGTAPPWAAAQPAQPPAAAGNAPFWAR